MENRPGLGVFFWMLICPLSLLAEDDFRKQFQDILGKDAFQAAGLNRLSEAELEQLQLSLLALFDSPDNPFIQYVDPEESFGRSDLMEEQRLRQERKEPGEISSRLKGPFKGWRGNTVFELENGQRWVQMDDDTFYISEKMNPMVTIRKGILGTYYLSVEGFGSRCRVKRLE